MTGHHPLRNFSAILFLSTALFGCASTAPADQPSMCEAARQGLAQALIVMDDAETHSHPATLAYWRAYAEGARIGIDVYCGDAVMTKEEIRLMLESEGFVVTETGQ